MSVDHRGPDQIPLSERMENAYSRAIERACHVEMAKRIEALEARLAEIEGKRRQKAA